MVSKLTMQTVDYDDFDFSEPPHDPIRERDEEGAWFDDEAPSSTSVLAPVTATASTSTAAGSGSVTVAPASPNGHSREHSHPTLNGVSASAANGTNGTSVNGTRFTTQNGQGEYDY